MHKRNFYYERDTFAMHTDVVSELNLRYYHGSFEAGTTNKNGDVVTGHEVDDVDAPLRRTANAAQPAKHEVRSPIRCTCDTSKLLEVVTDLKLLLRKALEELEIKTTAREGKDKDSSCSAGPTSTRDEEQHHPFQQTNGNGPLEEEWSQSTDNNHTEELRLHRTTPTVWHVPIDSHFAATTSEEEDESTARRNRAAYFEEAVRIFLLQEFTEDVLNPLLAEISRHTGLVLHEDEEAILNKNSEYTSSPISQDDHDPLHFCVHPTETVQAAMKRIAEVSQIGLARLHVVQLHFLDKKHDKQEDDGVLEDAGNKEASKTVAGRSRSATSKILPGQVEAGDRDPQVVVEEQQQQYEVHFHSDLGV